MNDEKIRSTKRDASGVVFEEGQTVEMLGECMGDDHEGQTHTTRPGAIGTIGQIETLPAPQGEAFHVTIRVDDDHEIVNTFDEQDGAPSRFFRVVAPAPQDAPSP